MQSGPQPTSSLIASCWLSAKKPANKINLRHWQPISLCCWTTWTDTPPRRPGGWTEDPSDIYQRQRALRSTNDPSWDLSFERKFLTLLNSLLIIVFMSVITATCFCSVLSEWMFGSIHLQNEGTISKMFSKKKERASKPKLCEMIFSELNCSYSHCALPWVKWSF